MSLPLTLSSYVLSLSLWLARAVAHDMTIGRLGPPVLLSAWFAFSLPRVLSPPWVSSGVSRVVVKEADEEVDEWVGSALGSRTMGGPFGWLS